MVNLQNLKNLTELTELEMNFISGGSPQDAYDSGYNCGAGIHRFLISVKNAVDKAFEPYVKAASARAIEDGIYATD